MQDVSIRPQSERLQASMMQATEHHVGLYVQHRFIAGVYGRECHIPAGVLVAGRIHKGEHLSNISQGRVEVFVENIFTGETESVIYEAPYSFVSPAGTKRTVLATEDTIWTTYHKHDGPADSAHIEDVFTWFDYNAYQRAMLDCAAQPVIHEVQ